MKEHSKKSTSAGRRGGIIEAKRRSKSNSFVHSDTNKTYLDFSFKDKLMNFTGLCERRTRAGNLSPTEIAFQKGSAKFKDEFNIFSLIKTIQKIKAAVSMMLEESNISIEDVKKKYFDMCEIIIDDD